jgi:ribose transport system permease protein/inositol transport system permease protein
MPVSLLVVLGLIVLLLAIGVIASPRFASLNNFRNIFQQSAALGFVSLGQTIVVLTGGIDLSVGAMISLTSNFTSGWIDGDPNMVIPVVVGVIALGAAIGCVNGALSHYLRVHPLIVTLGMSAILQGCTLLYSLAPVGKVTDDFEAFAYGRIFGLSYGGLAMLALFALVGVFLHRTRTGNAIYVVGGDARGARLLGISVARTMMLAYAMSGTCARFDRRLSRQPHGQRRSLARRWIRPRLDHTSGRRRHSAFGRPRRTARDAARRLSDIAAQQHSEFHGRLDLLSVDRSGLHHHHGGRDSRREGEAGVSEPISGELPTDRAASAFPTGQLLSKYGLLGFLVVNALVVSVLSPAFLKPENIANVLTQAAPLGIVVLGQTFVLLVGGVDLSVASVMATSAVIATGFAATDNRMVPVIFAAAIGLGLVVGLVNGFLVAKRNVSPFLATLATTVVLQGLRFLYTQGSTGSTLPSAFALMGAGRFLGVPVNLIALVVLAAIFGFVLLVSKHGRKIYLVGNNARGAILVGLPTDRIIIGCYALCSVIAAIAGLFLVGYVGQVDQWTGKGYELDSIVAAVMGGVAITGGRGNVFGALLGVVVLVVMFNAVILLGLPVQVQLILKGVIVIAASAFYLSGSWERI